MAYSFTDVYRPLRTVLRLNGLVIGLGLGLLLFVTPRSTLQGWGVLAVGPVWPARLAGALLITLGVFWLLAASEDVIGSTALITTMLGHGLIAIVLLMAYLQRDLGDLSLPGLLLLGVIFILCLVGALLPLRYLRADYRRL
jgi:hypothetical protein